MSYGKVERIAVWARKRLRLGPMERVPGLQLFESLDNFSYRYKDRSIRIRYHIEDLPDGVEGQTRYSAGTDQIEVCLSADTYENLLDEQERARFTLVHEIGHAVLHGQELVELIEIPHASQALLREGEATHSHCWDSEWQANAFACAFIAPAAAIAEVEAEPPHARFGHWDSLSGRVSSRFGLSLEASQYRVDNFLKRREELLP